MPIKIKKITAEMTYDLRHRIMWPNKPFAFIKLDNDKDGIHFGLYKDARIISVISLFTVDGKAQFRKFATELSQQGKGYGTLLLQHLVSEVSKLNIGKLECNARKDKVSYYHRFGMTETDKTYVKGGINFVVMEKIF